MRPKNVTLASKTMTVTKIIAREEAVTKIGRPEVEVAIEAHEVGVGGTMKTGKGRTRVATEDAVMIKKNGSRSKRRSPKTTTSRNATISPGSKLVRTWTIIQSFEIESEK